MITALFTRFMKACREVRHELTDPYRPERHYMRGPGPRCQEALAAKRSTKHG